MPNLEKTDFAEIVKEIEQNEIYLPDFQRKFVWKSEEMQLKLVASVLSRMPMGSILLLKGSPNEYQSKKIGCKDNAESSSFPEVKYLLDGQQRVTVLSNVFSNVIHTNTPAGQLISPSLKRRFFLRLPTWQQSETEGDLFHVRSLQFPIKDGSNEPDFLSGDVFPYIFCKEFRAGDNLVYSPYVKLSPDLDRFCVDGGYLIPLYLLIAPTDSTRTQFNVRFNAICNLITNCIVDEIINTMSGFDPGSDERKNLTHMLFDGCVEDDDIHCMMDDSSDDLHIIREYVAGKADAWKADLIAYLRTCINSMYLSQICVEHSNRSRAIDIYENLNRGGVSLSTFDLVMAKVAKVTPTNFYDRLVQQIKAPKIYSAAVLPTEVQALIGSSISTGDYNASLSTQCIDKEDEIRKVYIDALLNTYSLCYNNQNFDKDGYKVDYIKREAILNIPETFIDENCDQVVKAIDRALFFINTRCGIRDIRELNYSLVLPLLATLFWNETYFNDKRCHDLLDAWYWSVVFSGEFDKDQNRNMISHLGNLLATFKREKDLQWLYTMKDGVLNANNYSDKDIMLMKKVDADKMPKRSLRLFICEYMLACTYPSLFDEDKKVSVFMENAEQLEAHHIIPLGSVASIRESTEQLRQNEKHVCNSPVNFVLITAADNKSISAKPLSDYANEITTSAKAQLFISSYREQSIANRDESVKQWLADRFDSLQGNIKNHISTYLSVWS